MLLQMTIELLNNRSVTNLIQKPNMVKGNLRMLEIFPMEHINVITCRSGQCR